MNTFHCSQKKEHPILKAYIETLASVSPIADEAVLDEVWELEIKDDFYCSCPQPEMQIGLFKTLI